MGRRERELRGDATGGGNREVNAPTRTFADVGYAEAIRRARELVPALRERAARGESARRMLPETEADLHRTGLLRFAQPKR